MKLLALLLVSTFIACSCEKQSSPIVQVQLYSTSFVLMQVEDDTKVDIEPTYVYTFKLKKSHKVYFTAKEEDTTLEINSETLFLKKGNKTTYIPKEGKLILIGEPYTH